MLNSDLDAIVPMLCVTLAALVSMLAEAFREKDERMPMAVWGLIGLAGAGVSSALLWNRSTTGLARSGFGVVKEGWRTAFGAPCGFLYRCSLLHSLQ